MMLLMIIGFVFSGVGLLMLVCGKTWFNYYYTEKKEIINLSPRRNSFSGGRISSVQSTEW